MLLHKVIHCLKKLVKIMIFWQHWRNRGWRWYL